MVRRSKREKEIIFALMRARNIMGRFIDSSNNEKFHWNFFQIGEWFKENSKLIKDIYTDKDVISFCKEKERIVQEEDIKINKIITDLNLHINEPQRKEDEKDVKYRK